MPHDLRHGQRVEPTLVLVGSNHVEYAAQISLWTERLSPAKVAQEFQVFIKDSRSILRLSIATGGFQSLRNRKV